MAINPDHVELAEVATELINENGQTVQLVNEQAAGGPDYDPTVTEITQDVIAVRSKFSTNEVGDGSRIKSTDIKFLMDSEFNPLDYQKISDGVNVMQIIDATIIKPGEVSILYKVQARL